MKRHQLQPDRPQRSTRRGVITVEFCLVAPIIFMLFLGALEITSVNIIRQSASNTAYEAARKLVVPGGTAADAEQEAADMLRILNVDNGAEITVDEEVEEVRVTIRIPADQNSWGLTRFVGGLIVTESCVLSRDKF